MAGYRYRKLPETEFLVVRVRLHVPYVSWLLVLLLLAAAGPEARSCLQDAQSGLLALFNLE